MNIKPDIDNWIKARGRPPGEIAIPRESRNDFPLKIAGIPVVVDPSVKPGTFVLRSARFVDYIYSGGVIRVSAEDAAALDQDKVLYGNAYARKLRDGTYERIAATDVRAV